MDNRQRTTDNGLSLCQTKDKCCKTKERAVAGITDLRICGITELRKLNFALLRQDNKTTSQRDLGFARQRDN